jgi:hypothetical protein
MSTFRPDLDTRTCSACDAPVAEHLKGYMGSIRGCALHLEEWAHSPERARAVLAALAAGRPMGHEPFEAWAAKMRGRTQAMEDV